MFGKNTEHHLKAEKWDQITSLAKERGIFKSKFSFQFVRDTIWQNLKRRAKTRDKKIETGRNRQLDIPNNWFVFVQYVFVVMFIFMSFVGDCYVYCCSSICCIFILFVSKYNNMEKKNQTRESFFNICLCCFDS